MSDPVSPDAAHPAQPSQPPADRAHGAEAALRLQVIRQQSRLDTQAAQLTQQRAQIDALAERLRDTDARANALHQEVSDLRRSTSWRITAPLRALRLSHMPLRRLWHALRS